MWKRGNSWLQSQVGVESSAILDLISPCGGLATLHLHVEGGKNSSGKLIIVAKGIVELVVGKPGCQEWKVKKEKLLSDEGGTAQL